MKSTGFSLILATLVALMAPVTIAQNCPDGIRLRYDLRDLGDQRIQRYFAALAKMFSAGTYQHWAVVHNQNKDAWHFNAFFLPVHRKFLLEFENDLRKVDPELTLPYYDWSRDAGNPAGAFLWNYIERSGGQCVRNTRLGNNGARIPEIGDCLRRQINNTGPPRGTFTDAPTLGSGMTLDSFKDFANFIEGNPHYLVHQNTGGQMGTMWSAIDTLFGFHHGFIDKLWSDWQNFKDGRTNQFSGLRNYNDPNSNVSPNDQLPGWGSIRTAEVLDLAASCVRYMQPGSSFQGYSANANTRFNSTSNLPTNANVSLANTTGTLSEDFIKKMGVPTGFANDSSSTFNEVRNQSRDLLANNTAILPGNRVPVTVMIRSSKSKSDGTLIAASSTLSGITALIVLLCV
jgi:hypothetical protein